MLYYACLFAYVKPMFSLICGSWEKQNKNKVIKVKGRLLGKRKRKEEGEGKGGREEGDKKE
jgi:hypothetical protein